MNWQGVFPAITTPFRDDGTVDHDFLARHGAWLIEHGCAGIVALGSLGEGATLAPDEKRAVLDTCVRSAAGHAPVVAGVGAIATREARHIARTAAEAGCQGLMVLPPYLHKGPFSEVRAHLDAVLEATPLSCMLYNNPIAYGTDVLPDEIARMADAHDNLHAVKESTGDVRRITALRALVDDRLELLVGLDDLVVEGVAAGARGWIAGLANALPAASVELFELARTGDTERAHQLYRWFLPLLRMDTAPEFVQLIKLVQHEVGMGSERVRPPRQPLDGAVRQAVRATIQRALDNNPLRG